MLNELLKEYSNLSQNIYIYLLVCFALFDILTGFVKGVFFEKKGESNKGLLGLIKHFLVVSMMLVLYPYFVILKMEMFGNMFLLWFMIMYTLSFIENLGQIGVPVPKFIKEKLIKFKDDIDKGDYKK